MNRRFFLKSSGIALAGFGALAASPSVLQNAVLAAGNRSRKKILVTIFQRGAVDGLNMVAPYGSSDYYSLRPNIAVPRAGKENGAIDLDGYFGFNPAMSSLSPLWKERKIAVIHSVGSPDNTRSHFDAQDFMESGTPGLKSTRDGWLNRFLQADWAQSESPFRAVSMTQQIPRTMMGRYPTVAMTNLQTFAIRAGQYTGNVSGGFEGIWHEQASDRLGDAGKETFEAMNFLKKADPGKYKTENGAKYPNGGFANNLRQIAQLIKANVGLEVAFTDTPGLNWDTHLNQSTGNGGNGQLANLLRTFSQALSAFAVDLGDYLDDVVIVTMSEFGRTARENGSRGTDHGHGNSMLVIGNSIKGGVYGEWKDLNSAGLFQDRDLAITTDFRDVLGELVYTHLGNKKIESVFPNYSVDPKRFRGFFS